mmetsp:Transcript_68916/g.150640  ORF Transcript_68916/g.150640 Transcript_68916/m.150640 type:complete len:501 (-) Transcript_68916:180-1682(-)
MGILAHLATLQAVNASESIAYPTSAAFLGHNELLPSPVVITPDGDVPNPTLGDSGPWITGMGPCCAGVWSSKFKDDETEKYKLHLKERLEASEVGKKLWARIEKGECPYGRKLPGDVSWRGSIPVELQDIVAPQDAISIAGVVWSFLPYLVAVVIFVDFIADGFGFKQFLIMLWLGLLIVINEGLIKRLVYEPRPGTLLQTTDYTGRYVGSCVESCGMPSSHSAMACGWFVLLFLDAVRRVHPHALEIDREDAAQDADRREFHRVRFRCHLFWGLFLIPTPWVRREHLNHRELLVTLAIWIFIMLPVPFFRIVLYDHTTDQVLFGCTLGVVLALLWYLFMLRQQAIWDAHFDELARNQGRAITNPKVGPFRYNFRRIHFPFVIRESAIALTSNRQLQVVAPTPSDSQEAVVGFSASSLPDVEAPGNGTSSHPTFTGGTQGAASANVVEVAPAAAAQPAVSFSAAPPATTATTATVVPSSFGSSQGRGGGDRSFESAGPGA